MIAITTMTLSPPPNRNTKEYYEQNSTRIEDSSGEDLRMLEHATGLAGVAASESTHSRRPQTPDMHLPRESRSGFVTCLFSESAAPPAMN